MDTTTITLPKSSTQIRLECPQPIAAKTPIESILRFPAFKQWLELLDIQVTRAETRKAADHADVRHSKVVVDKITIQSVDEFRSGKIGFLKFIADATHFPEEKKVPGVVFLRGGAVAMLLILRTPSSLVYQQKQPVASFDDTDYVVLTEQPRLPVPDFSLCELPAGMLDDSTGEFSGTAAREIQEETGLVVRPEDLIDLTPPDSEVAGSSGGLRGLYPSAGGCDEFIRLFACEKRVSEDELSQLRGKLSGLRNDGEFITLRLVRLCDLWKQCRDMNATAAAYLWDRHISNR
ncbi:hypothetical protein H4R20_002956 [Coemansia guatemalensis]|uniref:Nudix hydrolase domain-containing protein n=1 Tax=Coemansia guatemalensis TaxID=2761395 RepID=A0A9W8HZ06_9FUNG|nr:hypothetical protein H4R20_002956 [Coemansia guatemalensis]